MNWMSIAIAAALGSASAAPAEPRALDVPSTAGWQHALTQIVLMPHLGGEVRRRIVDLGTSEYDVVASYDDPASGTFSTIYLFHPGAGSAPVWFDRVRLAMLARKDNGVPGAVPSPTAFASRGTGIAESLRLTVPFTGGSNRSSATAVVPVKDWLLVVRMSSPTLDAPALDTALTSLLKDIRWPAPDNRAIAATPVPACADQLKFKRARVLPPDMTSTLLTATLMQAVTERKGEAVADQDKPVTFCRDRQDREGLWGVYRANGSTSGYIVAFADAGRAVSVELSAASQLSGKGAERFAIVFHDLDRSIIYPDVDHLPAPEQALAIMRATNPTASIGVDGKQINIAMPPNASK